MILEQEQEQELTNSVVKLDNGLIIKSEIITSPKGSVWDTVEILNGNDILCHLEKRLIDKNGNKVNEGWR